MAKAQMVRTRLTDGSHVFDVILTDEDHKGNEISIELNPSDEEEARELMNALGSANAELDWEVVERDH
jgi:hypothetical protein